ncbi:TolB-like translocation protein [Nocardioides marmoraquaticus]
MSTRSRLGVLGLVVAVVLGATAWYLLRAREDAVRPPGAPARGLAVVSPGSLAGAPRIVFRSTAPDATYGQVAAVALDDPDGPRGFVGPTCDRVAQTGETMVCLRATTGITSAHVAEVRRPDGSSREVRRPGVPSRARVSPGGTAWASTAFVAGDSYATAGFSTRTFITGTSRGEGLHVEDFALRHQGRTITPVDRNFWGVSFVDDDRFYVTASFGGRPWLARGSVADRSVETIGVQGECPSVSPDGTRVAHKLRRSDGGWAIRVIDLRSGDLVDLPGERSVDDQVAWLDDSSLLYALPRQGSEAGQSDVWVAAADGSSSARVLIEQASSPSVVGVAATPD